MPVVSPTDPEPRFHVSITDGTDILSFVLYDINNKRDPQAIRRFPIQQSALKTSTGGGRYDDLQFPYVAIAQDAFTSGYGIEDLDKDKSGYWDGQSIDTTRENGLFLAGLPQFGRGYKGMTKIWPDAEYNRAAMIGVTGADRYRSETIYCQETFTPGKIMFTFNIKGATTGSFTFDIVKDSSGDPTGASIINGPHTVELEVDQFNPDTNALKRIGRPETIVRSFTASEGMVAETTYHLKFDFLNVNTQSTSASKELEFLAVWGDAVLALSQYSTDNSTWTYDTKDHQIAYVIYEDDEDWTAQFLNFKNNMYFVKSPKDGSSAGDLYMAGYRGAADDNSANKLRLIDATTPFSWEHPIPRAIDYEPVVCKIIAGPGSQEVRPWREVRNRVNTSTLQMKTGEDFLTTHTIYTEYVIEGVDTFQLIDDSGVITKPVTDVEIVNNMLFMAQGTANPIVQYTCYNDQGVWKDAWTTASQKGGEFLKVQHDYKEGKLMWIARNPVTANNNRAEVLKDTAPPFWHSGLQLYGGDIVINNTDWDEYQNPNATVTFENDTLKIVLADAFTSGILVTQVTHGTPTDLTRMTHLRIMVRTNKDLGAGELQFLIDNTAQCASPLVTVNAPALLKDKWEPLFLDVTTTDIDMTAVQSFGIQLTADEGAGHTIEVSKDVEWHIDSEPIECGKFDVGNITGLEVYDDPERLYVFTESELGYISGNKYQAVPLREMRHLRSSYNGRANAVGGVYLYFGLGADGRVQQYFRQTLNDIGPTRDNGVREDRRGHISALIAYPGDRVYAAVNGGDEGYSTIQLYAQGGWHEVYRSFQPGQEITAMWIQPIEGQTTQKLWFNMSGWIMWVPITFNAMDEKSFIFNYYGELQTSWIYMGMHDIYKVFRNVKVFMEGFGKTTETLDSGASWNTGAWLRTFYQFDGDFDISDGRSLFTVSEVDSAGDYAPGTNYFIITQDPWRYIGENDDITVADIDIGTSAPWGVTCRRMQLRFGIFNTRLVTSPRIMAWVIKGYAIQDVKHGYAMTTKLTEGDLSIDLEGDEVKSANYAQTVELAMAKLDSWAATVTPLTINAIYSPFDNKTVVLNSIPVQPIRSIPDDQVEEQLLQLTVEEL